ncbi:sulfite exporter TauE/SafE family protein [Psychromonas ossibalaenae]|uniref:sulfite exporter TauE/SafE family protein n=1 Tax=Psychromonas ossibalaenae TaxID=444922 RepID=UPI00037380C9|nr:TSUP family transporter [Psychromonas ossibalaenae]
MTEVLFDPSTWVLIVLVGLAAGFIDAVVGGGGMLTVPTLLSLGLPPHLTLGTNKLSACFASGTAAYTYFKKQLFSPQFWKESFYSTLIGAAAGTVFVNLVSTKWLEKLLPLIILAVAVYSLFNCVRDIDNHQLPPVNRLLRIKQSIQGFLLGFYDGASGPGTGAFWVLSTMRLYRLNILLSSGIAKSMNFTSNLTSFAIFLYYGQVNWLIGLTMGFCLMLGAYIGAHSAIHFGAKFIRPIFISIVVIMALNLGYNAWLS